MCAVRSGEVVEPLPFVEFGLEVDVAFVTEELIEFLLIGTVGSLDFAVQLRCAALYVGVPNPKIFNMPMELGLELVTIIRAHLANAKRELFDDVVNEVDRVCLRMFLVDLEGAHSGCIVDRCVLKSADLLAAFSFEGQKFNVHLDVMSRHLLLIAFGVQFAHACASGQSVEAVTLQDAVDPSIGDFDAVITRQIPNDPDRPQVILAAQIQNFFDDLSRGLIGRVLRD